MKSNFTASEGEYTRLDIDDGKNFGHFTDLPLKLGLSFKSKRHLKRDVWDNARSHGWLPD